MHTNNLYGIGIPTSYVSMKVDNFNLITCLYSLQVKYLLYLVCVPTYMYINGEVKNSNQNLFREHLFDLCLLQTICTQAWQLKRNKLRILLQCNNNNNWEENRWSPHFDPLLAIYYLCTTWSGDVRPQWWPRNGHRILLWVAILVRGYQTIAVVSHNISTCT